MPSTRYERTGAQRLLLLGALCAALCVSVCASASSALGAALAKAGSSHASAPPHPTTGHANTGHRTTGHRRGSLRCAKPASFHSSGGPRPRARHRAACHRRRHAKLRHRAKRRAATRKQASHASSGGDCANADVRPNSVNLEQIREATLCLINRERTSRGESALVPDAHLQLSAQLHSSDMAAGDYFDHTGQGGDTPLTRMRSSGYIFSSRVGYAIGENIGWGTLWLASPRSMVSSWMNSPEHRANILDAQFRDTGVGVSPHPLASLARGQAGAIYTQDFGVIITG